jgi:pSer/pThr/pTyr-binding forkhead associated (FHA) protein
MPTLEVTDANGKRFYELTADETVVGRDQFCDIVLRNHTVSRQHARIVKAADGFYIEDLSSLNGTYINGRRVEGRTSIKDQDRIHVYEVVTVFHQGSPEEARAASDKRPSPRAAETVAVDAVKAEPTKVEPAKVERTKAEPAKAKTKAAEQPAVRAAVAETPADSGSQARFRAALKVSVNLEGAHDIDQILPRVLDNLFEIFPQAARGYILLAEGADGHLVPRAIKHRQSESGHSMTFGPISRKTALRVMSTAEAIMMDEHCFRACR